MFGGRAEEEGAALGVGERGGEEEEEEGGAGQGAAEAGRDKRGVKLKNKKLGNTRNLGWKGQGWQISLLCSFSFVMEHNK